MDACHSNFAQVGFVIFARKSIVWQQGLVARGSGWARAGGDASSPSEELARMTLRVITVCLSIALFGEAGERIAVGTALIQVAVDLARPLGPLNSPPAQTTGNPPAGRARSAAACISA